jgi:hypothetical protein
MNPERRGNEIGVVNGVLWGKSTLYTVFYPIRLLNEQILKPAGYTGGFEWLPNRTISGFQLKWGLVSSKEKSLIRSAHQSYRSERRLSEAKSFLALASFLLLPEKVASLDQITRMQKDHGRKLPVVIYPPEEGERSGVDIGFGRKLIQPGPEIMASFRASTPGRLISEIKRRGYDGLCLDLVHMRRLGKPGFDLFPWEYTLPELLTATEEIHVGAGRNDAGTTEIDHQAELADLYDGTYHTDLPRILRTIRNYGWQGRVVIEIPADAIAALLKKKTLSVTALADAHRRIVNRVGELIY